MIYLSRAFAVLSAITVLAVASSAPAFAQVGPHAGVTPMSGYSYGTGVPR